MLRLPPMRRTLVVEAMRVPFERISIDPTICHGQACVKGTRIPVHQVRPHAGEWRLGCVVEARHDVRAVERRILGQQVLHRVPRVGQRTAHHQQQRARMEAKVPAERNVEIDKSAT
jgi:hypothetical protein